MQTSVKFLNIIKEKWQKKTLEQPGRCTGLWSCESSWTSRVFVCDGNVSFPGPSDRLSQAWQMAFYFYVPHLFIHKVWWQPQEKIYSIFNPYQLPHIFFFTLFLSVFWRSDHNKLTSYIQLESTERALHAHNGVSSGYKDFAFNFVFKYNHVGHI